MDQNEASKGTEMKRNVPTDAQLTKISQSSERSQSPKCSKVYCSYMNPIDQN